MKNILGLLILPFAMILVAVGFIILQLCYCVTEVKKKGELPVTVFKS